MSYNVLMSMRFCFIIFMLTWTIVEFTGGPCRAADAPVDPKQLFEQGVGSFRSQKLAEAEEQFKSSLAVQESAHTLYNLGLTEWLQKKQGLALGHWRRGLLLEPNNPQIQRVLEWAQAGSERAEAQESDYFSLFRRKFILLTPLTALLIVLAISFFSTAWLLLKYAGARRTALATETPMPAFPKVSWAIVLIFFCFSYFSLQKIWDLSVDFATVVSAKTEVHTSPDNNATSLVEVKEGTELIVQSTYQDWAQVTLTGGGNSGVTGWVLASHLYFQSRRVQ